jgi:hypothetical protein
VSEEKSDILNVMHISARKSNTGLGECKGKASPFGLKCASKLRVEWKELITYRKQKVKKIERKSHKETGRIIEKERK